MTTRLFLYFADRDSAVRAVTKLKERGFKTEMGLGWDDPFWNVVATQKLQSGALEHADNEMRELASSLGGDYGGFDQRPLPPARAA